MNTKRFLRLLVVILAALALTALVATAQEHQVPTKEMPAIMEQGESASPAANLNESEPNNSFATADYIEASSWDNPDMVDVISGTIGQAGDIDYYTFSDEAGYTSYYLADIDTPNAASPLDAYICAYDHTGAPLGCNDDSDGLDSLLVVPYEDEDGRFYIAVQELNDPNEGGSSYTYTLSVYYPLLLSATTNGTVSGVPFQAADILAFSGSKWMLFFDASDVGITANTTSIAHNRMVVGLAFAKNQTIHGANGSQYVATPWDIARFNATQWGPSTQGEFATALALDGSTVGLSTTSEKIDAYGSWSMNSAPSISTTGAASLPAAGGGTLKGRDEDLLALNTANGKWTMALDGSTLMGLAAEDVVAATWEPCFCDNWMIVIQGNSNIEGIKLSQKDILYYEIESDWFERIFHGPDHGFNYNIDGLN